MKKNKLVPFLLTFVLINALIIVTQRVLVENGFDIIVLTFANILLFTVNVLTYLIQSKALQNSNPNVFVRSVMAGMMIKMAVCVIAVFTYVSLSGPAYNKRSVFVSMFLYLLYLAVESGMVMKLNKNKHD